MTWVATGLGDPPEDLRRFPRVTSMPARLHRLSPFPLVWWFSSAADAPRGGRFDLPAPEGTCYLADSVEGALSERLLRVPVRVVVREQLLALFHATVTVRRAPEPVADLADRAATRFGVNAEIHTTLDYDRTRGWARALRRAGFKSLRYLLRSDPSVRWSGYGLFGRAGLHRRAPAGLRTETSTLDVAEATAALDRLGVHVLSLRDVPPVIDPP